MLKRGVTLSVREQRKCMEQCLGEDENLLRAYGSGLADRSMWCVSATDCMMRKMQQTKPSSGNLKKPHLFKPCFSRNASAIAISVEEAIQQTMSNLGCFWSASMITSWQRRSSSQWRKMLCWTSHLQTRKNWLGMWTLRCSLGCWDHKIVKFSFCSGSCFEELHERWQMVDF